MCCLLIAEFNTLKYITHIHDLKTDAIILANVKIRELKVAKQLSQTNIAISNRNMDRTKCKWITLDFNTSCTNDERSSSAEDRLIADGE